MLMNLLHQRGATPRQGFDCSSSVYTPREVALLLACDPYDPVTIANLIAVVIQNAHPMWSADDLNRLVTEAQNIAVNNAHRGTSPINLIDELREFFADHGISF